MSWLSHLTIAEIVLLMGVVARVVALLYGELFVGLKERKEAKKCQSRQ
jgi:hypothetical protein